jgi:adenosylmethionine---8-amino-7-oxononanoate aminotransferase
MKTGNQDLLNIDRNHIWHPFTSLQDTSEKPLVTSADGIYLYTADGRKIIDAVSSWWVNIHGHANKVIAQAIFEQASTLEHVIFAGFTHTPAITLTQNLLSILPPNQSRVFFSDNGSTAVEVGIKMAMQYWFNKQVPKTKIIAFNGAYHGDTFGSMSVGDRGPFTTPFAPWLFDVNFIDVPTGANFQEVVVRFSELAESGEVAAFIYEPLVQGANGMVMYEPQHLENLLAIAKQHQVICIADEVFTGFGRTGKLFASGYMRTLPDIMCVSKGITGGTMPLGVTTCSLQIEAAFQSSETAKTFFHGHSYTANPIACAAANASFNLLMDQRCQNAIQQIEKLHRDFVQRVKNHKQIKDARSLGTILAVEIETGENTSYFNNLKTTISAFFLQRNILIRPLGNIFYVLPPYVITEIELNQIYESIIDFLTHLETLQQD